MPSPIPMAVGPSPRWAEVFNVTAATVAPAPIIVDTQSVDVEALTVLVSVTAATGTTPSLTVTAVGVDPATGINYPLGTGSGLTTGAMTSAAVKVFRINVALPNTAALIAQDPVPPQLLITPTHLNSTGILTYTVSVILDL